MDNIYLQTLGTYRLFVDVARIGKNIDSYLETTLKAELEGKCKSDGYVKRESVRIMKRSLGYIAGSHFTGKITFDIVYACDICNPAVGNLVKARVTNINKLGFLAENGPLMILVARQYYENKEMFKDLEVNQEIVVEVIGKRFQLNDHKIEIIGKIYQEGASVAAPLNTSTTPSSKIKTINVGNIATAASRNSGTPATEKKKNKGADANIAAISEPTAAPGEEEIAEEEELPEEEDLDFVEETEAAEDDEEDDV